MRAAQQEPAADFNACRWREYDAHGGRLRKRPWPSATADLIEYKIGGRHDPAPVFHCYKQPHPTTNTGRMAHHPAHLLEGTARCPALV